MRGSDTPFFVAGKGVVMDYEQALRVLDEWEYHALPDGAAVIEAIEKGQQAIRDCLELGLDGKEQN